MTEKIIHFLWLNFKNKSNGILDTTLSFFKDRIESLHKTPTWEINYIDNYQECYDNIDSEDQWLKNLLDNSFVGPAHKSDALRYYYLYKLGGVWIDISTFLVKPVDELVEQNKDGFTCYYMPSDILSSWIIKLSSDIFENISAEEYKNKIIPLQNKLHQIKDNKLDFISENYFLISKKENEVCKNVLDQLKEFWTNALPNIKSEEDYCYELNKLMYDLIKYVYKFNIYYFPYLDLIENNIITNNIIKKRILKEYFDCSYFFNYLQLYKAIREYTNKYEGKLIIIPNTSSKIKVINDSKVNNFSKLLCNSDNCNNKIISFSNEKNNINLLSASYNRLSKYSDNREERINWENTLAGNILKTSVSANEVLQKFIEMDITQLKYSSYTRSKSKSIGLLKTFFNDSNISLTITPPTTIVGGKYYKIKKNLKKYF